MHRIARTRMCVYDLNVVLFLVSNDSINQLYGVYTNFKMKIFVIQQENTENIYEM